MDTDYSIEHFWRLRFASVSAQTSSVGLRGWICAGARSPSFVEASLSLRNDFNDLSQSVWLIAAPGAVGKSTLAREICASTNAVYLDLATAATVAGNYLVGGLVNANLWDAWRKEETTLLVDALDEARLRITQSSFEDFLADVANVARSRRLPIVLLGRVGIVEEAWTIINDKAGVNAPIFDIELFQPERAKTFVLATLRRLAEASDPNTRKKNYPHLVAALSDHATVYNQAAELLVGHLTSKTSVDGRQFAGYAPVLEAVATVIASESNPAKIDDAIKSLFKGEVLKRVTTEILIREAAKLANQLGETTPEISTADLYGPDEQLSRLASLVLGVGCPELPTSLPQHIVAAYEAAVQSLLPQHPFLDSKTQKTAGAVFGACVLSSALTGNDRYLRMAGERFAGSGQNTPNPFLLAFYGQAINATHPIPAEHIGFLYSSLEAIAKVGETVRLTAEGENSSLDVEMSLIRKDDKEEAYKFTTIAGSELRFGRRIGGITVDAEEVDVEIGGGDQLELIAPITLKARNLTLNCSELVVKPDHTSVLDQTVYMEATQTIAETSLRVPIVRSGVKFQISWPDSKVFPWTHFASDGGEDPDPRMADAQRALRRLCIAFRSHSKGRLARYKDKVEHLRMSKGKLGEALRRRLLEDQVLSRESEMYFLDPNLLGSKVGISFQDLKIKKYSTSSRNYLQQILDSLV